MKKFFCLALVSVFFAGCGEDSKSGAVANVFEPTDVVTKNTDEYFFPGALCLAASKNELFDLDQRVAKGQVYSTSYTEIDYGVAGVDVQKNIFTIEYVDHDKNFYTFMNRINFKGQSGWLRGKTEFMFSIGFLSSSTTYFDASTNYKPLLEKINKNEDTPETYWYCDVQSKNTDVTEMVQLGKYTLTSGKKVNASRAERVTKGEIICTKYFSKSYADGEPAQELESRNLGLGQKVEVRMYSKDIPNKQGCAEEGMELEYSTTVVDANQKTIQSDVDRLENAVY